MRPNPLSTILHRTWWVLLLRGLVAMAFGVLTFAQPAVSLMALMFTFGAFIFVDGVLGVYSAIRGRGLSRHWWVLLLWGLAGVIVGVLTVVAPGVTALVMTLYIAVWSLITGVLQIIAALRLRQEIEGEWLLVLGGVLSVLFGGFVLANPGAGMMAMLWVLALYAVLLGLLMVLLAFKIKKGVRVLDA
ncbi:HdeD family acid-resistance protein [Comamonas composti]|uniref:HdeD family acid-resistance protein n=1 Tax=Comamonas composti TaxID=408558 RepID=UPI000427537E|nr:HdeD family acid-resistance protein [Comamonas composti]